MTIKKLLFKNREQGQFFVAIIGAIVGTVFLISSIHYLIRINEFGTGEEILGPNTLVIQKKVTNSSSLNLSDTHFDLNEIERIKKESFVLDAQAIVSNNFDVSFETSDSLVPRFRSDVFIQTVDKKFLDIDSAIWIWKEGQKTLPIVMPRDFLVMLNTFMSASGIPQVSEDLARKLNFKFTLQGNNKKDWFDARIVGFSNEIPSLLVPESFMNYGKEKYGDSTKQLITQIMLTGKEGEFGKMEAFLEKRGLESRKSQVIIGKLKSTISILFVVVLSISVVTVFSAGLIFIQYLQLLIANNKYEVKTLLRLGHHPKTIIFKFVRHITYVFGAIMAFAFLFFILLKYFIDQVFHSGGIYIETSISYASIFITICSFILFVSLSYYSAKSKIIKEF
mgnify:CR=1 FL=1